MTRQRRFHGDGCQCGERTILATPLGGPLAGKVLKIPIDGCILLIGFGGKLRAKVRASWVSQYPLEPNKLYVRALLFGPVLEVKRARTLAQLDHLLGRAFVQVDPGIVVALAACLVPDVAERQAGLLAGYDRERQPIIEWVTCTESGAKELRRQSHPSLAAV